MRSFPRFLLHVAVAPLAVVVLGAAALPAQARDLGMIPAPAARALAELPARLAQAQAAIAVTAARMPQIAQAMRGFEAIAPAMSGLERIGPALSQFGQLEYAVVMPSVVQRDIQRSEDQVGDSLYRRGRELMNRGSYRDAADLFRRVYRRDPRASIAADALYWHAYSMYRAGGTSGLETALESLERLREDHPRAAIAGDARDLRIRVCGALARQGDEKCASEVASIAEGTSRAGSGSSASTSSGQDQQGCPREDDDERMAALNALLQMDSESALPLLERTLARRDRCSVSLRKKAVFMVSQKRTSRAADVLLGVLRNDPDPEVRGDAIFWLGQLRDERAVDMLSDILQRETNEAVLDKAVFALSQHRSERASTLLRDIAQRDGAPLKLREQAIFWIGQRRSSGGVELLMNLYTRVDSRQLKDKIIFAVSQSRSSASDKWLLDRAMNDDEPMELRKQAIFWAGQSRTSSAKAIGELYDRMRDREMKEQIIFVLSQKKDADAVDKLFDIARNDRDREMRSKALFWLGQTRDPRVLKLLEEIINK